MEINENQELARIIKWMMDDPTAWEILCNRTNCACNLSDAMLSLDKMLEQGMYQFAILFIAWLSEGDSLHAVLADLLYRWFSTPNNNDCLLTKLTEEMKQLITARDIQDRSFTIN